MARMSAVKSNSIEIVAAQLDAVRLLIERIDEKASSRLVEMILRAGSIFITGQGRSGLVAQCLAAHNRKGSYRRAARHLDFPIPKRTANSSKTGKMLPLRPRLRQQCSRRPRRD